MPFYFWELPIMKNLRTVLMLALATISGPGALGQTTFATVTGLVTDANSAVVPMAKVELTNAATNIKYTGVSNETGLYTVTGLQNGRYELRATAAGFAAFVVQDIELVERDFRRIDVSFKIGTVQTTVE